MPIRQTFTNKGEYLLVNAEGPRTVSELRKAHEELASYCKQHNIKRVVADSRGMVGELSELDMLELGTHMKMLVHAGIERFAIIMPEEDYTDFGGTVATNRGVPTKIFINLEEAKKWITMDNE